MPIIVMICFARSGGTVLNQCLGSLPNVLMISETTPLIYDSSNNNVGIGTIKDQAKQYYQIDLKSNDFGEVALELSQIAAESGRQLVIRDWTYASFFPFGKNPSPPPERLVTLDALEHKCQVIPFCFVRDAIDVWLSLRTRLPIRMKPFFEQYVKYVRAIKGRKLQIFKYEDFATDPEATIKQSCAFTGLEFSSSYKDYTSYHKVTGDVRFTPWSRGRSISRITSLPRRYLPNRWVVELNENGDMRRANELLGYPTSYYAVERETRFSAMKDRCRQPIFRYAKGLIRRLR